VIVAGGDGTVQPVAQALVGTPRLLPKTEIENVLGRIAGYGPADK